MSAWESLGQSGEWYTPPHVFEALGERFDLDVAHPRASKPVTPCDGYYSHNSLNLDWFGFVWMNPPFGGRNGLKPWLDKFFAHSNGIALTPDRTSAPWFRDAWAGADLVLFTPKLKFLRPDGSAGKSPSCGTALFAAGPRAEWALRRAAAHGLGILAQPVRLAASLEQAA